MLNDFERIATRFSLFQDIKITQELLEIKVVQFGRSQHL